ncbi:MAG: hypothetical protein N3D18_12175 [Roseococcus sp.]|nr:hypothetical protein [Roseococcus sp.]
MAGWEEARRAWQDQKRAWKDQRREERPEGAPAERRGPVFGWRVWLLPLFFWPLVLDVVIELFRGHPARLAGGVLGLALAWMAAARMARGQPGDLKAGAVLFGVAAGLAAGLAAQVFPPFAVALGFGAYLGARLLTADLARHEPLPEPAPPPETPPQNDPLAGPRAQLSRVLAAAPHLPHGALLIEAAGAMQGVIDDLALRPTRFSEARRFLTVQVDGLSRIVERLEAGAQPPATLPPLLAELAAAARRLRTQLREAESEALDIQVKVLSDRLRQEGL